MSPCINAIILNVDKKLFLRLETYAIISASNKGKMFLNEINYIRIYFKAQTVQFRKIYKFPTFQKNYFFED